MEGSIFINQQIQIPVSEVRIKTVRSSGPGGQHVNKVETAIQLQFDIPNSSLPDELKEKILLNSDKRINKSGILLLRSETYRSQEKNKELAFERLIDFIRPYTKKRKKRINTLPTKTSLAKRKAYKINRSHIKVNRQRPLEE